MEPKEDAGGYVWSVDADRLTWGDLMDLEEAETFEAVREWIMRCLGYSEADLRAVPMTALYGLKGRLLAACWQAIEPGKSSGGS